VGVFYYQSETIVRNVLRLVEARGAASMLDIGAGSPMTGRRFADRVQRYLAVEENARRAKLLGEAGLDVRRGRFPLDISQRFDLVLSSHSVPELAQSDLSDYRPFIYSAWNCVAPGGSLLIITFKGAAAEISALNTLVFDGSNALPRDGGNKEYLEIISILSEFSNPSIDRVRSHIVADTAEELLIYITPWINGSTRYMSAIQIGRLRDAIESRYHVRDNLYVLPTEHLFIRADKSGMDQRL
jgi:hypothetical protein